MLLIVGLCVTNSQAVTHHCIHEEGDGLPQHVVVFGGHLGPAEEPVQLVEGGHLARRSTERRRRKYLLGPDLSLLQVGLVCEKESRYRSPIREFHLKGGLRRKEISGRTCL